MQLTQVARSLISQAWIFADVRTISDKATTIVEGNSTFSAHGKCRSACKNPPTCSGKLPLESLRGSDNDVEETACYQYNSINPMAQTKYIIRQNLNTSPATDSVVFLLDKGVVSLNVTKYLIINLV